MQDLLFLLRYIYCLSFLDKEQIGAKRRKKIPHFSDYFQGGGGGPPGMGGAGGGGFGFTGFGLFPTFNLMGLQPSSQGEFNRSFLAVACCSF